jgi:RNA polymerase sigma-70 factor, ECF subfamily
VSDTVDPAAEFEARRSRLFGLAYRMLGTRAEAEDVVQEAYVRWHEADKSQIRNADAWLVAATTRLAIDRLRRLKTEREAYVGQWLPEPLMMRPVPSPDASTELASDLSMAFLVLLERLGADERAAFLLHEVFDVGYPEIARILGRSEAACRQMVHRARERVRSDHKRFDATREAKQDLLGRFMRASQAADAQTLLALFSPDATWTADGGGRTPASPRPIVGPELITKLVLGLGRTLAGLTMDIVEVNGEPALALRQNGEVLGLLSIAADGNRIARVYVVLNPDKLAGAVTGRDDRPSAS